ncbi:MAG: ATP-binding protein [Synechococcales bacterium]|nr:ATP-binding protein [Synechococcales bacterium]
MNTQSLNWSSLNYHYLTGEIAEIRALLQLRVGNSTGGEPSEAISQKIELADFPDDAPPAIARLCETFNLSTFERRLLLFCLGAELSRSIGSLCATLHGNPQHTYPTFGLALTVFPEADWQALLPVAGLRRWHLIEVSSGSELMHCALRLDERILHELIGLPYRDDRLRGILMPLPALNLGRSLPTSHQVLQTLVLNWITGQPRDHFCLQLYGEDRTSRLELAQSVCATLGLELCRLTLDSWSADLTQLNLLKIVCEREAILSRYAFWIDYDRVAKSDQSQQITNNAMIQWIETLQAPIILSQQERQSWGDRVGYSLEVLPPTPTEQIHLWQQVLSPSHQNQIDRLVSTFNFNSQTIQAIGQQAQQFGNSESSSALWNTCLEQARPRFDGLAQPIHSRVSWEDLVLPEKELSVLRTIAAHVRQRAKVYEDWGFAAKSRRGLGISALFAGASGTGKTLAAEVLANALNLDLYRIDISSVVSKYIGETEKNLRKIFDAAESGGTILLFDEADALFGKRSDVKDSHDRYANMEVAYLLQRIEAYRGLAILTTNLKDSIDQAFLRRIRFVVQFPFPDVAQRTEIWRRVFPPATPTQDLAHSKLARLSVTGGNIRNIALNAAFLAADAGNPVTMMHILQAAQAEYIKLERPLTEPEIRGWTEKAASF